MLGTVGLTHISWGAAVYAAISLVLAVILNRVIKNHRTQSATD